MMRIVRRHATLLALVPILALGSCDQAAKLGSSSADEEPAETPLDETAGTKADPGDGGDGGEAPPEPTSGAAEVAWQTAMVTQAQTLMVSDDGVVVFVFEDRIEAFKDNAKAWTKEGAFTELVRLADGTMVAAAGPLLTGFDPTSGDKKFEVTVPAPETARPKPKKGKEEPPPGVVGAATFGSQLLVATEDARFFVADPPACAKEEPACLRPAGLLEGEFLEPAAVLTVGDDGTRFLAEDEMLRAFDLAMELKFELEAHSPILAATPVGQTKLALSFGGELAFLDVEACSGRSAVKLANRDYNVAPKGCLIWRYGNGLDEVPPAVIDDETLAANGDQRLQAVIAGDDAWKSPIGSLGRVVAGNDGLLYTMAADEAENETKVSVKAVDPKKGTVAWEVELPFSLDAGGVVVTDSLTFDWRGQWIAAGLDEKLAVISIPGPTTEAAPPEPEPEGGAGEAPAPDGGAPDAKAPEGDGDDAKAEGDAGE